MWCWYRQVTLTANAVYFLIAWPGGVREGRAAFATVSALPSQRATLRWSPSGFHTGANLAGLWAVPNRDGPPQGFC